MIDHVVAVSQLVEPEHCDSMTVLCSLTDVDVGVVAFVVVLVELVIAQAKRQAELMHLPAELFAVVRLVANDPIRVVIVLSSQ